MNITLGKLSRQEIAVPCAVSSLPICCGELVSSFCFLFPHLLSSFHCPYPLPFSGPQDSWACFSLRECPGGRQMEGRAFALKLTILRLGEVDPRPGLCPFRV